MGSLNGIDPRWTKQHWTASDPHGVVTLACVWNQCPYNRTCQDSHPPPSVPAGFENGGFTGLGEAWIEGGNSTQKLIICPAGEQNKDFQINVVS